MQRDRFAHALQTPRSPTYIVGLDVGQAADYTAMAVLQLRQEQPDDPTLPLITSDPPSYDLVRLERIRRERYPTIVRLVADELRAIDDLRPRPYLNFAIDFTGVGRPVFDMFLEANLPVEPIPVLITGGTQATRTENGEYHVPKRDLASVLAVLSECGRLEVVPTLALAKTLTDEMINFKVTINARGHDSYGAGADWREGNHDDLVLATAVAAWVAEHATGLDFAPLDDDVPGFFIRHGLASVR